MQTHNTRIYPLTDRENATLIKQLEQVMTQRDFVALINAAEDVYPRLVKRFVTVS